MTPRYAALKSHFTVKETLQHIRNFGKDAETLGVIYVVDNDWRLINDLRIEISYLLTQKIRLKTLRNISWWC